jgi:hypothetical protein
MYLVAEHGFSKNLQAATWLTFGQRHLPPSLLWPVTWHALYVTQNLMLLAHMWAVFCGYPTMHHDILAQTAPLSQPKPLIWKHITCEFSPVEISIWSTISLLIRLSLKNSVFGKTFSGRTYKHTSNIHVHNLLRESTVVTHPCETKYIWWILTHQQLRTFRSTLSIIISNQRLEYHDCLVELGGPNHGIWHQSSFHYSLCLKVSIQTLKAVGFSVWKYQSCMQECKEWEDQQIQARCMLETEGLSLKITIAFLDSLSKVTEKGCTSATSFRLNRSTGNISFSPRIKDANFLPLVLSTLIQVQNKS